MANPKKASSKAYESFVESFSEAHAGEVAGGSLFGMPCLKRGSKSFAGSYDGGLVVKLSVELADKALRVKGATTFDPSGRGKPMKGWIVLPKSAAKQWGTWAESAFELV